MDPLTAMTVIGAVLVGASLLSKKGETVSPELPANDTRTIVGKNADALGYERIAEGESLGSGQVQVVTDDAGNVVGEVAQTEGGTLVFASPDGSTRVVTEGEVEIDQLPPAKPVQGSIAGAIAQGLAAGANSGTNGAKSFPAPKPKPKVKRPVTSAVTTQRINAARAQGFRFRF